MYFIRKQPSSGNQSKAKPNKTKLIYILFNKFSAFFVQFYSRDFVLINLTSLLDMFGFMRNCFGLIPWLWFLEGRNM